MAAWYTKASYLFDIYQEPDSQVAHLLAAVYFYATRLNYVSPDLEWLANAFVAERKMKLEQAGDSTTWTPETRASLEAEIRHAFFNSKAKADTMVGKGTVRPLFDPDKPPRRNNNNQGGWNAPHSGGRQNFGGGQGGGRPRFGDRENQGDPAAGQNRGNSPPAPMAAAAAALPGGDPPARLEQASELPEVSPDVGLDVDAASSFEPSSVEIDLEADPLGSPANASDLLEWDVKFFAQFIPRIPPTPNNEQLVRELRELLMEIEAGPEISPLREGELTEWIKSVVTKVNPVESFVAGCFGRHLPIWEELLKDSTRPSSKTVLSWLRNGIKPSFVGTAECDPKKLERVRLMLRRTVGVSRVEEWLSGEVPHPVEFPNHRSFYENSEFALETVGEMLVNGSVHLCAAGERKPKVVNPLGVVNLPKGRLVLDAGYINAFSKAHPFKYETLRDILTFLSSKGFFATWDFKAGYYHVLIHPRFRTYFGFKIGTAYFYYNAMCFGWSEACYAYTLITQEAAKELRTRGVPVSSYLDDGLTANQDFALCLWLIVAIVRFLTLLGAVFSLPKCQFWPVQTGDWLGFVVDTQAEQFRVSTAKMTKVKAALGELLGAKEVSPRILAKVAGKIIALGPAVLPASLYSRPLFQAMQGRISWDAIFATPQAAKDAAKLFLERLDDWNGRRWFPRQIRIEAASDASDFGFGGSFYIAGSPPFHLAGSLTETEVHQSSTAREMIGFLRILQQAVQRHRPLLSGAAVLLVGDNQGAVAAVNNFRSSASDVNAALQGIFKLCSEADFDVLAQWKPRIELAEQDALSRVPDASDWGLTPKVFADVISLFGRPDVDLFASDTWHVAGRFVTPRYMPGCLAVDALRTDWRTLVKQGETAWIFPPVRAIPSVLQSLRNFRTDAILVVPEATTTNWWVELMSLGSGAVMAGPLAIERSTDACIPSRRVPAGTVNPALYKLRVFKINWK
ncbi:reverse transcriptase [Klebsormidium nitens]|uniref:Reverse transcriptase n=1 Tax=Klebsormidium nitens TaxID=105231 RepID=A0A1Y1I7R7_KLENI|nr:reverse transcriptase [Klebsormidium nitens]|eukprot:GAQ85469.1 reverse transcriptase [Klebsormidium nitens]